MPDRSAVELADGYEADDESFDRGDERARQCGVGGNDPSAGVGLSRRDGHRNPQEPSRDPQCEGEERRRDGEATVGPTRQLRSEDKATDQPEEEARLEVQHPRGEDAESMGRGDFPYSYE